MTEGLSDGLVMNSLICIMRVIKKKKLNEERSGSGRNENEIEIANRRRKISSM